MCMSGVHMQRGLFDTYASLTRKQSDRVNMLTHTCAYRIIDISHHSKTVALPNLSPSLNVSPRQWAKVYCVTRSF